MNKYRFKLAIFISSPLLFSTIFSLYYFKSFNSILFCLISLCLLFELLNLSEFDSHSESDNGTVAGLITSSSLGLILTTSNMFMGKTKAYIIISCVILITGVVLRILSRVRLGKLFSHSLRITYNHQLIITGPYRYIRHPSYLGTILIVVGASLFISLLFAFFTAIISILIANFRIINEEKLLTNTFNQKYIFYRKNTWKLIPFLL